MASIGTGYDLSATVFSPDGRIFQVEYAQKAVESSGTIIGLKTKEGVVLAVEKIVHSKLLRPSVNRRIITVDSHAGMVGAGFAADCRQLANRAREEATQHRETFEAPIPAAVLAERLGLYMQAYTLYASVRPFGSNTILAVVDKGGPHLFMLEPSGVCWGYRGCAAGKGRQIARTEIEKLDLEQMSLADAVKEAARIIYLAHNETKDKDFELEISWVADNEAGHQLVPASLLDEATKYANEAMLAKMEY